MRGVSLTQGTMGLVRQALEGFGLVGAVALGLEGLGLSWRGWSRHRALGPGEVQHDEEPHECEQDELSRKKDATPWRCPLQHVLRWGHFTRFWGQWNYPQSWGTRPIIQACVGCGVTPATCTSLVPSRIKNRT